MSDELAKNLQEKATVGGDEKPKKKFNFNFKNQAAFKPSFTPGSGGSFAFQDFSNYAQPAAEANGQPPAQQPPAQQQTVTLDQFQKKGGDSSLNTRGGGAKTKKVLSLGKKPESAAPAAAAAPAASDAPQEPKKSEPEPAEPKPASPASEAPAKSAESPAAPADATTAASTAAASTAAASTAAASTAAASTAAASTAIAPSAAASAAAPKSKDTPKAESGPDTKTRAKTPEAVDADAVIKEQAQMDQEVVQDMFGDEGLKEHLSIIFMGHVDAGKSTMGGNILYLTGSVDKRTIEKYEREAMDAGRQGWYLSWVMDTNKEERNEGKTIEVGRAVFETEKRRYTILDAPGHKMYVPSMIGGASQADAGILVISARSGEYETGFEKGGQTREHAILAKTQGVDRLVVVVNKMDDPTVNWSKERYDECTTKLGQFLKATGYSQVTFMPVSGYTGAGLKDRVAKELAPWYDGPSLLEWLDNLPVENRKLTAPFMLPVSSKAKDLGTVVEGKIEAGTLRKGTSLVMMPGKTPVEVSAIYNESEAEINGAIVGEQVKIKLKGIDEESIQIGNVLTSAKNPISAVTRFEAQVALVDIKSILTAGFSCVMHVHTAVEEVTFTQLLHKLEKGTNRKSKKAPAYGKKGMKVIAVLEAAAPVCIEEFAITPQLGRFTLRDQGQTIAIGKVTKILDTSR